LTDFTSTAAHRPHLFQPNHVFHFGRYTPPDDTSNGQKDLVASVEKLVIVKDEEIGMIPDLKHLYGGKEDKRGRFTWYVKHSSPVRKTPS
jgi:hypothetical protein